MRQRQDLSAWRPVYRCRLPRCAAGVNARRAWAVPRRGAAGIRRRCRRLHHHGGERLARPFGLCPAIGRQNKAGEGNRTEKRAAMPRREDCTGGHQHTRDNVATSPRTQFGRCLKKKTGSTPARTPRPMCSRVTTTDGRSPGSRIAMPVAAFPGPEFPVALWRRARRLQLRGQPRR